MAAEDREQDRDPHLAPTLRWESRHSARAVVRHGNRSIPVVPPDAVKLREQGAVTGTQVEYTIVEMKDGSAAARITSAKIEKRRERYKKSKVKFGKGADRAPKAGIRFVSGGSPGLGKKKGR